MSMKMTVKESSYVAIAAGLYTANLESIEEEDGIYGPQFKLTFWLPRTKSTILAWTSQKMTPKSKLYGWVCALLGTEKLDAGYEVDLEGLIHLPCIINVKTKLGDDGQSRSNIADVLPMQNLGVTEQAETVLPSQAKLNPNAFRKPQPSNDMPNLALV